MLVRRKKDEQPNNIQENQADTKKSNNIITYIILAIVIVLFAGLVLWSMRDDFVWFYDFANRIGNGNLFIGLLLLTFSIWGIIQLFRAVCDFIDSKIYSNLSLATTILGIISFFYVIIKIY